MESEALAQGFFQEAHIEHCIIYNGNMKFIFLLPLLLSYPVQAKDYGTVTISEITSIYDADTFRVNIRDYPPIVGERVSIRVNGVDAPEIRGKR